MTIHYTNGDLERFVDGACSAEEAARIRLAMDEDNQLALRVHRLEALNTSIRKAGRSTGAPATLRQNVVDAFVSLDRNRAGSDRPSYAEPARRVNRRALLAWGGSALAAGLAGLIVLPRVRPSGPDTVATFIRDFETVLLKDEVIDVTEDNMVRLAGWYGNRLSFALPPIAARAGDARLVGGRLCWLLERRLASLSYQTSQGPIVLYVMDKAGIPVPAGNIAATFGKSVSWHRADGHACIVWVSGNLLYVMVGDLDVNQLMANARSLAS